MTRPTRQPRRCTVACAAVAVLSVAACGRGDELSVLRPAAQADQVRIISGFVWVDADGDGNRSADEPNLGKRLRVIAVADESSTSGSTFVQPNGSYSMAVVGDGDLVVEVVADGFNDNFGFTTPRTLTWPDGDTGTDTYDFGLGVTTVSGAVWVDIDGDLVRDPGEPPSVGAAIEFSEGSNTGADFDHIAVTDDNGEFSIDLVGDTYYVSVNPPDDQAGLYIQRAVFAGDPVPWSQPTPIDLGPPDCPSAIFPQVGPDAPIVIDLVDSLDVSPGCLVGDRSDIDIALSEPEVDVAITADIDHVVVMPTDEFEVVVRASDLAPLFGLAQGFTIRLPAGMELVEVRGPGPWGIVRDGDVITASLLVPVSRNIDGSFFPVPFVFRAAETGTMTIEPIRRTSTGEPWRDIDLSNNTVDIRVDVLASLPTVS